MRGIETEIVLEVKERGFNAPAKVVEFFNIGERAATSREIGNEVFRIAVVKPDTNKAEREAEDRGFIVQGDKIEATVGTQFTGLQGREIAKRDCASGEEEFGIDRVIILVRDNEMVKRRARAVRIFEAKEEELVFLGDGSHGIEGIEAAVSDKEAGAGDRIAVHKGDASIVFIHKGTGLNDGIGIAPFQKIEESDGVELIIAAVIGIVRDKGIGVFISGDVEVGTVAGQEMQAEFGFTEGETRIEALEQGKKEIIFELCALANEGGGRGSGTQGEIGITNVEEAKDFTAERAFLHGHHEQDHVLERKATVAGEVPTGAEDKIVQMIFHSVDVLKE